MNKKIIALMITLIFTFSLSISCFAAQSPTEIVIPTEEPESPTPGGETPSPISPKTGFGLAGGIAAIVTAGGIAIISKKKYDDAK